MTFDAYDAPGAPGAALLVLRHGRTVHTRCGGLARLEGEVPVEPRTNFRLASITKQFTAKVVAQLAGAGHLSLETPVHELVPDLPPWAAPIRVGHLIAHTSGIPAYEELVPDGRTAQLTDRDVVRLIARAPGPRFAAGARFAYDNGGYALLAVLVEEVTGRRFGDVLDERIFRPLGMAGTVAHVEGRTRVARRALGYRRTGDRWELADQGVTTATLGDGGIYSSLDDLARWDAALRQPGYQPDAALLAPFTAPEAGRRRSSPGAAPASVAYGWGWHLDELDGRRRQRHEGWSTGFQNEIQRYPDEGLTVVVLTNRAEPPVRALAEAVAREAIARRW